MCAGVSERMRNAGMGGSVRVVRPLWKETRMTWILLAANIMWFFFVEGRNGYTDIGFLRSGALDVPDVAAGQWYRLVSSMFVHFSLTHLTFNMVSLGSLYIVEWLTGPFRFICLYFFSGLAGSLLSVWFGRPDVLSGGASGAIFGIFGVALAYAFRGILSKVARNQMLFLLGINLLYDVSSPNIGTIAHLGGLAVGLAFGWWGHRISAKMVRWIAWAAAAITVITLVLALQGTTSALVMS